MPVNGCKKGKVGEREAAKYLREIGFPTARRTQQHNGDGKSDVTIDELPDVHIEVKFGYANGLDLGLAVWLNAVHQARRDSAGCPWVVLWKPLRCQHWRATFEMAGYLVTVTGDEEIARAIRELAEVYAERTEGIE